MLKSITFYQRGLEQAELPFSPFDEKKNLDGDMEIIAGNAFRPDNVEIRLWFKVSATNVIMSF